MALSGESIERRTAHLRFLTLISIVLGGVAWFSRRRALCADVVVCDLLSGEASRFGEQSAHRIGRFFLGMFLNGRGSSSRGSPEAGCCSRFWTSALVAAIQGLQPPSTAVVMLGIGLMAIAAAAAALVPLRRALAADATSLMR